MEDYLRRMPKTDLHCHLDGSVSAQTLDRLARRQGLELPTHDLVQLEAMMRVPDGCRDLIQYLRCFDFVLPYLQAPSALEEAAYDLVETAAAEAVGYMEVRFAPHLHTQKGMSCEQAVFAVAKGLERGQEEFGILARIVLIAMRDRPVEDNMVLPRIAAKLRPLGVVGLDIAGDEGSHPPMEQREMLELAAKLEIPFTIHAGESGPVDHVADAIALGAKRLGHGIRLVDSPQLMALAVEKRIGVELCPTSSLQTGTAPAWDQYPARRFFEAGVRISVNTNNRTVSGTSSTQEYGILARELGFTRQELRQVVLNSLDTAFLTAPQRAKVRNAFQDRFRDLGE